MPFDELRQVADSAGLAVNLHAGFHPWPFQLRPLQWLSSRIDLRIWANRSAAVGSTGSLRNLRTIKLISPEEGRKILEKAKATKAVYSPPGARQPASVR